MTLSRFPGAALILSIFIGMSLQNFAFDFGVEGWKERAIFYRNGEILEPPLDHAVNALAVLVGIVIAAEAWQVGPSPFNVVASISAGGTLLLLKWKVQPLLKALSMLKATHEKHERQAFATTTLAEIKQWHVVIGILLVVAIVCELAGGRHVAKLTEEEAKKIANDEAQAKAKIRSQKAEKLQEERLKAFRESEAGKKVAEKAKKEVKNANKRKEVADVSPEILVERKEKKKETEMWAKMKKK